MNADVTSDHAAAVVSDVDTILRQDPAHAYAWMDARSREDYRDRIRMWAERAQRPANEVAQAAIDLAAQAYQRHGEDDRRAHVGYFLTDDGIAALAAALHARLDWREKLRLRSPSSLLLVYCTAAYSLCGIYGVLSVWLFDIRMPWFGQALLALSTTLYVSGIIPGWFNMFLSRMLRPRWMPRLDFSDGIPASAKTLVVIPCLLTSRDGIRKLAQTLEHLQRSNSAPGVGYAMLSDFVDADTEQASDDEALLAEACAQINALNERHRGSFVLLHRPRRWNQSEGRWIGWERKRGKLEELNAYLAGGVSPFQTMRGDIDSVTGTRYVLTLDDDNADLTPGTIHQLAGALSHPLNRPVLSEDQTRVEAGHVLLQPRIMVSLPTNSSASRLEKLFNSTVEIETSKAYRSARPTVDVDQDVFGQAVFVGKGMYDVDMFHRLTHGLIAENTVLSHDGLEGGLVRAGVVTDIVLDETFVPTFHAVARRTHRWQRGDWQLIPWLFLTIRNASGVRVKNPLSLFGRWKLFQNLMRVMFPIAAVVCFMLGWATSAVPGRWTLNLLAIAWIPAFVGLLIGMLRNLFSGNLKSMLRGFWASLSMRAATFIFAVDHARNAADAISRASFRMWVSHRRMLEWTASIMVSMERSLTLGQYIRLMWFSPLFAVVAVWFIARVNPPALPYMVPFAALWFLAPFVAWWWSQTSEAPTHSTQSSQS